MGENEMDRQAVEAAKEFPSTGTVIDVATWWKKWFLKAGHKRLARILLKLVETPKPGAVVVNKE